MAACLLIVNLGQRGLCNAVEIDVCNNNVGHGLISRQCLTALREEDGAYRDANGRLSAGPRFGASGLRSKTQAYRATCGGRKLFTFRL